MREQLCLESLEQRLLLDGASDSLEGANAAWAVAPQTTGLDGEMDPSSAWVSPAGSPFAISEATTQQSPADSTSPVAQTTSTASVVQAADSYQTWATVRRDETDYMLAVDYALPVESVLLPDRTHGVAVSPGNEPFDYLMELIYSAQSAGRLLDRGDFIEIRDMDRPQGATVRVDDLGNESEVYAREGLADYLPLAWFLDSFLLRTNLYERVLQQVILQPERYREDMATGRALADLADRARQSLRFSAPLNALVSRLTETNLMQQTDVLVTLTDEEAEVFIDQITVAIDVKRFPRAASWLRRLDETSGLWQALARMSGNIIQRTLYDTLVMYLAAEERPVALEGYLQYLGDGGRLDPALSTAFGRFKTDFYRMKETYGTDTLEALMRSLDVGMLGDLIKFELKLYETRFASGVSKTLAGAALVAVSPIMDALRDLDRINVSTLALTLHHGIADYLESERAAGTLSNPLEYNKVRDLLAIWSTTTYAGYLHYEGMAQFMSTDPFEALTALGVFDIFPVFKYLAIVFSSWGVADPAGFVHGLATDVLARGDSDNRYVGSEDVFYSWLRDRVRQVPDLTIIPGTISVVPGAGQPGDALTLRVRVSNEGGADAYAIVSADFGGLRTEYAAHFESGAALIRVSYPPYEFALDCDTTGFAEDSYLVTVRVRTQDVSPELTEANNEADVVVDLGSLASAFIKEFPIGMLRVSAPASPQYLQVDLNEYFHDDDPAGITVRATGYSNLLVIVDPSRVARVRGRDGWKGTERVTFVVEDPSGASDSQDLTVVVSEAQPAALLNGTVTPASGYRETVFTYRVTYSDTGGAFPKRRQVYVNGVPHMMTWNGSAIADGAEFAFALRGDQLVGGTNTFWFEFADSVRTYRYPEHGVLSGPVVPVNHNVALQNASLEPAEPRAGRQVTFQGQVRNAGTMPEENILVRFSVNGVEQQTDTIESLWLNEESYTVQFLWTVPISDYAERYEVVLEAVPVTGETNIGDNSQIWSFTVEPEPGAVSGWVFDQYNNPVEGATVRVVESTSGDYGSTNADGYYFLDGLKPGSYTLEAYKEGLGTNQFPNVVVHTQQTTTNRDFILSPSGLTLITSGLYLDSSQWAPAGDKIAFTQQMEFYPYKYQTLTVVNQDGSGFKRYTGPDKPVLETGQALAWSPDGNYIYFIGRAASEPLRIWRVSSSGSGVDATRLVDRPIAGMTLSPDGNYIAYTDGSDWQIWRATSSGSGAVRLSNTAVEHRELAWSSDGTKIAFLDNWGKPWIFNLADATEHQISDSRATGLSWLPQSTGVNGLLFASGGNIWLYYVDSAERVQLTYDPEDESYPTVPEGDPEKIAYISNKGFAGIGEMGLYKAQFAVPTLYFKNVPATPDPFTPNDDGVNDLLTISYSINEDARVTIKIHDSQGNYVKTLLGDELQPAGVHQVQWDGINEDGNKENDEVYFYRLDMHDATDVALPAHGRVTMVKDVRPLGENAWYPRWSPDGSKIVYLDNAAGALYVADAPGAANKQPVLTPLPVGARPAWFPTGDQIVFPSYSGDPAWRPQIAVINPDGTGYAELTEAVVGPFPGLLGGFFPSVSPVSNEIVFAGLWNEPPEGVFLYITKINADGSGLTKIGDDVSMATSVVPAWSPDGSLIAFPDDANGDGNYEIFIISADGSGSPQQMTSNPFLDLYPEFTSDGRRLLFGSNRQVGQYGGIELWTLSLDDSDRPRCLAKQFSYGVPSTEGDRILVRDYVIELFLSLTKGAVEGRVLDGETLEPIPGALVSLSQGGPIGTTFTNEQGAYQFWSIEPGEYEVEVAAPGYITSTPVTVQPQPWVVTRENDFLLDPLPSVVLAEVSEGETIGSVMPLHSEQQAGQVALVRYEYRPEGTDEWHAIGTAIYPLPVLFDTDGLESGAYDIRAVGIDELGNEDSAPEVVSLVVDHTAPQVILTAPQADVVHGLVGLAASSPDADAASVLFQYRRTGKIAWTNIGSVVSEQPWFADWDASHLFEGDYELRAVATDARGNSGVSPIVTVAVSPLDQAPIRYVGPIPGPGGAVVHVYDCDETEDVTLGDVQVRFGDGPVVSRIQLGGYQAMEGLGIVISGASSVGSIKDGRKGAKGDVAFIASDAPIKSIQLRSGMTGYDLNGLTLGDLTFPADIDGSGDTDDATSIYTPGYVQSIRLEGDSEGDIWIGGEDSNGVAVKSFQVRNGGYHGDLTTAAGSVGKIDLGGTFGSGMDIAGSLRDLRISGGDLAGLLQVGGAIGKLSVQARRNQLGAYVGGSITSGAEIVVSGQDSQGYSLRSLQLKGGDFGGYLDLAGGLGSFQVRASNGAGGWLRAGASVTVGGLLQSGRIGNHDHQDLGEEFGFYLGGLDRLQVDGCSYCGTTYPEDLPHEHGDFVVELLP